MAADIEQRLTDELKDAMRSGDDVRRDAVRMLRAALKNEQIELRHPLSQEEAGVVAVFPGVLQQRESPFVQIADHDFHYTGKRSRVQRSGV